MIDLSIQLVTARGGVGVVLSCWSWIAREGVRCVWLVLSRVEGRDRLIFTFRCGVGVFFISYECSRCICVAKKIWSRRTITRVQGSLPSGCDRNRSIVPISFALCPFLTPICDSHVSYLCFGVAVTSDGRGYVVRRWNHCPAAEPGQIGIICSIYSTTRKQANDDTV
jgi:hypothetical protein